MFFTPLKNTFVLLQKSGGLTSAPLFERAGEVYAKIGASWHKLTPNGNVRGSRAQWLEFGGDHAGRIVAGKLAVELKQEAHIIPVAYGQRIAA